MRRCDVLGSRGAGICLAVLNLMTSSLFLVVFVWVFAVQMHTSPQAR
jgi:hypothetical protein